MPTNEPTSTERARSGKRNRFYLDGYLFRVYFDRDHVAPDTLDIKVVLESVAGAPPYRREVRLSASDAVDEDVLDGKSFTVVTFSGVYNHRRYRCYLEHGLDPNAEPQIVPVFDDVYFEK